MKNLYKNKRLLSAFTLLVMMAFGYSIFDKNEVATKKVKQTSSKKSLIVNGVKYDGPEKMAYYQAAVRVGQEDLNIPLRYPQYDDFYKVKELKKSIKKSRSSKENNSVRRLPSPTPTFIERGPANVPGRTRIILVDPDDATQATWIAGNASGGIWKTTNSGGSWVEIAPELDNMAISTMALAASNSSIIYAGTGEGFLAAGTLILNGDGIYKSTDKGDTWTLLQSTLSSDFINVSRIIVDPTDADIVVASTVGHKILGGAASTSGAIMRSTDGGVTWTKVHESNGQIQQVIASPSDFNIQYASINSTGVVKSTDAGLSWEDASTGLSLSGRLELAVSYSNPDKVFGSAQGSASGSGSDLYVTSDGGENWNLIPVRNRSAAVDFLGGQGWYDNTILVNPFDDDNVYFGGVGLFAVNVTPGTTDASLSIVADPYGSFDGTNIFGPWEGRTFFDGVHPDQHFMTPVITDAEAKEFRILLGNDGGMYLSNAGIAPGTADDSWTWSGANYNTTQFYGADKLAGKEEYLGGSQDNGTWISKLDENASATSEYQDIVSGDGFEVVAHYTNPTKVIGASQFNGFVGYENRTTGFYNATQGLSGNGPFVSRLSNAYQDPDVLYAVEGGGVYKSVDFGRNWKASTMNDVEGWGFWSGSDVEVSKADPRIVWAGGRMTAGGTLFVSEDGGITFNGVPNFDNIGLCSGIYSHPTDPNTAFALFSVADSPKVLKTTDLGQTWVDISGFSTGSSSTGFPNVATFALQAMPYDDNVLWAGTEIGLFESIDGGATWSIVDEFPSVTIWDFKIKDGQVVIATHGRGIWTADIPELVGVTIPTVTLAPRIISVAASFVSQQINLSINLRSEYDITKVFVDDVEVKQLPANAADITEEVTIDIADAGIHEVHVISTKSGIDYPTLKYSVEVTPQFEAVSEYVENFEEVVEDEFSLDNFTIDTPAGFDNNILSTVHPYPTNYELIAKLNRPIVVASENATLKFEEIVQVEEGDPGTVFGDTQFWDYVIVEGTKDGTNWIPFLNGYDADANSNWSGSATTASPSLFVERTINLHDAFSAGDVIVIRFRLFSDGGATGWGWGIDKIAIQAVEVDNDGDGYNSLEDCDDDDPNINPGAEDIPGNGIDEDCSGSDEEVVASLGDLNSEIVFYPNPVSNYLKFDTPRRLDDLVIYNMNGATVGSVKITEKGIDVSQLEIGVYIVIAKSQNEVIRRRFIKQ